MAQLVAVKTIDNNGTVPYDVSLSEITMSGNQDDRVDNNGPVQHLGKNGISNDPQLKSHTNGNGTARNGSPNVVPVNETLQHGRFPDETHIDLEPTDESWTTKPHSAIKLRVGNTDTTSQTPITVVQLLERTVKVAANRIAIGVKREGKWQNWTYSEYYEEVHSAAKSFIKLGLEPYHGVGIVGFNAPEWLFSELGAIFAGGLAVGIYTTNSAEACHYVASDAKCNVIVVENKSQLDKILQVWDRLPHLKAVIQYIGQVEEKRENVYDWNEFLEVGKDVSDETLQERVQALKPNKCCTLIYTSGTTGNPKGAMLSHDNLTWLAQTSCNHVDAGRKGEEHIVSFLPLSHIAAQQTDVFMPIVSKATVWFAQPDALKGSLVETLREARPTFILGVPRVWEKIMEKLLAVGSRVTGVKRKVANWAKGIALEGNQNMEQGRPVPFGWTVATSLILKKIKVAIGMDRCRLQFVGAAPVTMETLNYFQSINIPLYELYGMSECTGPHTVSIPGHIVSGSCGITLPGCQSKVVNQDEDGCGELCMKGRHVFMGYLNNEEKTKESLDDEGWLHSGDLAKIDQNQQVYITGRIKELIITAGGENIAPVPLEDSIKKELPLISNVMVIGDKRKFLSCLLTLKVEINPESGEPLDNLTNITIEFCKSLGSEAKTVYEILSTKDEKVMKAIQDGINRANDQAPSRAQKVQKWQILGKDFSVHGGEIGPTLKLRRPIVAKMYKASIDAFYDN